MRTARSCKATLQACGSFFHVSVLLLATAPVINRVSHHSTDEESEARLDKNMTKPLKQENTTEEIEHNGYQIRKIPQPDPIPVELHPRLFAFTNVVSWGIWMYYIVFQIGYVRLIQRDLSSFDWHSWAALLAEALLPLQSFSLALSHALTLFWTRNAVPRPSYRLLGDKAPTVDIVIPCCGEKVDVIIDTVAGAAGQDYPEGRFRIFILDDGGDQKLEKAVDDLVPTLQNRHAKLPLIKYMSRKVRSDVRPEIMKYPKAGNNQFGIEETERLGGSEYFASLDADMIPERDWLRRVVPHLILDNNVAMANSPQVSLILSFPRLACIH